MKSFILAALIMVPGIAAAATLQTLMQNLTTVIINIVIPFLFGIAFLVFVINVIRFFVIGGHSEEGRENAKNLIVYSVAAFVFILIFLGVVTLLVDATGLGGCEQPLPDYLFRDIEGQPPPPC